MYVYLYNLYHSWSVELTRVGGDAAVVNENAVRLIYKKAL